MNTPTAVNVCIDPTMPSGYHFLFVSAATSAATTYGALPLIVNSPAGSITVDKLTVSLSGASTTQILNVSVSGAGTIQSQVAATAQPGSGNWLSAGIDCTGLKSCQTLAIVDPSKLSSPIAGTTYLGKLKFTASDGSVAEVLVQYEFEPSGTSPIVIDSAATLNGLVDESFNATLHATGGTPPYTWSATGLPAGLSISSSGVISGSVSSAASTQASITVRDSPGASKTQAITLVFRTQATAVATQVFPHIASDPDGWQTDIFILNTSVSPVNFTLRFHTDTGAALSVQGVGSVSQISSTIAAHGTAFYRTDGTTRSDGWAEVDSPVPLSGVAIFRLHAPDGKYYEASNLLAAPATGFTVPFDSTTFVGTSAYLTGLAIANADPTQEAQLTCSVYDSSGKALASGLQGPKLAASGHSAFLLQNTAPFSTDVAGVRGQIVCTANTKISAIALRALNYSVSSVAVVTNQ